MKIDLKHEPNNSIWFTPDPAIGREYVCTEQFTNPYLAMGNNPVMYIDPDGRHSQPIVYWDDDGNSLTGADGGLQYGSQIWTNLIYHGGTPSNNSWLNDYGAHNGSFFAPFAANGKLCYYSSGKGEFGYWNDHNVYTTDGVVSEEYGTTPGILFPTSEWVSLGGDGGEFVSTMTYINTGIGAATGFFSGNYGLTSGQIFKYAQRINGKIFSAAEITAANTAQSLRVAGVLGRVSVVGGAHGVVNSGVNLYNDYDKNGNGWGRCEWLGRF